MEVPGHQMSIKILKGTHKQNFTRCLSQAPGPQIPGYAPQPTRTEHLIHLARSQLETFRYVASSITLHARVNPAGDGRKGILAGTVVHISQPDVWMGYI